MSSQFAVLIDTSLVPSHGIRIVTLNRPHRVNAVDDATADLLEAAFIEFEEDPESRVCVFTGAGGNFCAGFDLKTLLPSAGGGKPEHTDSGRIDRKDMRMRGPMGPTRLRLSKPVIAAIAGNCRAGGVEMACWATLRVVESSAQLGVTCRLRGVPLIDGGTIRLPALIGLSRATDLMLTGRTISGTEAHTMGLSNHLSLPGASLPDAITLAKTLSGHPQTCMRNDLESASEATYGRGAGRGNWQFLNGGKRGKGVQGRYNVYGGEEELMRREYELGMRSLDSGEYLKALGEFFGKDGLKRRGSKI